MIPEDRDKTACKFLLNIKIQDCNVCENEDFFSLRLSFNILTWGLSVLMCSLQNKRQHHSGCALCPALTVIAQVNLWLTGEGGLPSERVDPGSFHEAGAWMGATRGDVKASQVFVPVILIWADYCWFTHQVFKMHLFFVISAHLDGKMWE